MEGEQLKITTAEEYAALSDNADKGELVRMPSGAVFRLRRIDVQGLALIGELPLSLVTEGINAWKEQGKIAAGENSSESEVKDVDADKAIENLIFLRQTVVDNCLEPRMGFSETGVVSLLDVNGKAIAKLKKKDFVYAWKWITSQEGVEAGRLGNFPNRQARRTADAGARRKKLRNAPIVPA